MTTPTLPQETIDRIEKDAERYSTYAAPTPLGVEINMEYYDGYNFGAKSEATRALPLIEALRNLRHGIFKDVDAVNQLIDETLNNYNQK